MLLDVYLPGMNGLELQARLIELNVGLPIIVMTGHGDITTAVRAMKAGAADFIEKPFDDKPLLAAIEAALGYAARERSIAEAATVVATLSPRERDVLDGILAGRPNKIIAFDLGISPRTVEVHRARMLERLGVRNIAGAIRLAVMAGLASS
jgi:two-component system response regulator FixJ